MTTTIRVKETATATIRVQETQTLTTRVKAVGPQGPIGPQGSGLADHETTYDHTDIAHTNRTDLDLVSGTNTGDQDLTGLVHSNRSDLDLVSGTNTGDQDLSSLSNVQYINFDSTPTVPAHAAGNVYWDEDDQTLLVNMGHPDVSLSLGQEEYLRGFNNTGSPLPNGTVVYVNGTQGNRPSIAKADASTEATNYAIGVVTHTIGTIGDDRYGYVTTVGIVRGIDTSGWTPGVPLWLSETAGEMTQTRPDAPAHAVYIGIPLNSTNNGSIFVNPNIGNELNELHDVAYPTPPAGGEGLVWNGITARWENTVLAYEPADAAIQGHISIVAGNPHGTTTGDIGAEPADAALQGHIAIVAGNPHGTTVGDIGAEPADAAIQSHIGATGNPHNTSYSDVGAAAVDHDHDGDYEPANANLQGHILDTNNPHSVNATDVGLGNLTNEAQIPLVYASDNHVPTGFVDHSTSTLSLTENFGATNDTFRVTITGTNFPVYIDGTKFLKNTEYVTQVGATSKRYYIYYASDGTFTVAGSPWSIIPGGGVPVATVLWDAVTHQGKLEEERHHSWRDVYWHAWAHHTIGARYTSAFTANALNLTNPGVDEYATFAISAGDILDEDIRNTFAAQTTCDLYYHHSDGTMLFDKASTTPYKLVAGIPQYDTQTGVGNKTASNTNGHFVSWVYGTNAYEGARIAVVLGQDTDGDMSLVQAQNAALPTLPANFIVEWKLIWKMIFRYNTIGTITHISNTDYRNASSLPAGQVPTTNVAATSVGFAPAGNISSTNVQAAIEELDTEKLANVVEDTTPQLGGQLDLNEKTILFNESPASDDTWNGIVINATAGENVAKNDVCYLKSDGKWWKADADNETDAKAMLAMATGTINAEAAGDFLLQGFMRDDGSFAYTAGAILYLSLTAGAPTSTIPPTLGDFIRVVGWAYSADVIYFNPTATYVER